MTTVQIVGMFTNNIGVRSWKPLKSVSQVKYCPNMGQTIAIAPIRRETVKPSISKINITQFEDSRLKELQITRRADDYVFDCQPENYCYIDINGKKRMKPYLFIESIAVKPEFARQGACSEAERKIIELSKQMGCEGRVKLVATRSLSEANIIPSPSLAHWKNGFRFTDESSNQEMYQVLAGEFPLSKAPLGEMYYPV